MGRDSRFHWPSHVSCSIATAILEDGDFVDLFLKESRRVLREHRDLAASALEKAGIPFAQGR
jgi:1-aminocyclopropane-1-carboxylate synthase